MTHPPDIFTCYVCVVAGLTYGYIFDIAFGACTLPYLPTKLLRLVPSVLLFP